MKDVDSLEKYVLEEIRQLKWDNANLQARIKSLEEENRLTFIAWDTNVNLNAKYIVEMKDNQLTITKIDGEKE